MTVTEVEGRPVGLPGRTVTFRQKPIAVALQPNATDAFFQGFQLGDRDDGRMAGPTWSDPQSGEYELQFDLNVNVSVHNPGETESDFNPQSDRAISHFVEAKQANKNEGSRLMQRLGRPTTKY